MIAPTSTRPERSEYPEYYCGYVDRIGEGDILDLLSAQRGISLKVFASIDERRAERAYASGKWTIKEVVGHIVDVERVFAYRALCFARGETAPQPGFDQDSYVRAADFNLRSLHSIVQEFSQTRDASLGLFRGFQDEVWLRAGVANGVEFTVRAIANIIAGHELHHLAVIKERYL